MINTIKIIILSILIPMGVFLFVDADVDDSPGGQLLALVIILLSIWRITKNKKLPN